MAKKCDRSETRADSQLGDNYARESSNSGDVLDRGNAGERARAQKRVRPAEDSGKRKKMVKKLGWWLDSVRGLKAHIGLYKHIYRLAQGVPPEQRTDAMMKQLRRQEEMIGFCLLHVILVHPIGSGRMYD